MKRTLSIISLLAVGISIGYFGKILADKEAPQKYGIHIDGLYVTGELSDYQKKDIEDVTNAAKALDGTYPIMSIEFKSPTEVEVRTGIVRGPLDGGGRFFDLKKQNGKWIQVDPNAIRSWVS